MIMMLGEYVHKRPSKNNGTGNSNSSKRHIEVFRTSLVCSALSVHIYFAELSPIFITSSYFLCTF